ncbi:MAG: ATP synthase F1 subunit delta [Actinomycetia bacterium]|nr:ATP synthase F1 subunit delta [Actinomycetes bacterium]
MAVAHRIYASALLEAAREKGTLPAVREEFSAVVEALTASSELRGMLLNPQVDARTRSGALDATFAEADPTFRNFLVLLAEKGRLADAEEVHREFERLVAIDERVMRVELTTAQELSEGEAQEILAQIEQRSGRRVEATRTVDPDLIGGLILQAGSMRVDASVRGRLDKLREELVTR